MHQRLSDAIELAEMRLKDVSKTADALSKGEELYDEAVDFVNAKVGSALAELQYIRDRFEEAYEYRKMEMELDRKAFQRLVKRSER